jgi:hypothetical protein
MDTVFNYAPVSKAHKFIAPPLLLWLAARRLVLKLLPFLCSLVMLPVDHVAMDLLGSPNRPMPQAFGHHRQRYATGQQVGAVRVLQRVGARPFRKLQLGSFSRRNSSDRAFDNMSKWLTSVHPPDPPIP